MYIYKSIPFYMRKSGREEGMKIRFFKDKKRDEYYKARRYLDDIIEANSRLVDEICYMKWHILNNLDKFPDKEIKCMIMDDILTEEEVKANKK
jgi:hypothetical protein